MLDIAQNQQKAKVPTAKEQSLLIEELRMQRWLQQKIQQGQLGTFSEEVTLTPVLARLLLEINPGNRPLRRIKLETYERDINTGRWWFNGASVIVSDTGELNDGQHRCQAVLNTGRPIRTMITFGPPRESRLTIDNNAVKSPGDYAGMVGFIDSNSHAAIAANIIQYRDKNRLEAHSTQRPTKTEIIQACQSYAGPIQASLEAVGSKTNNVGSRAFLAFCHWAISQRSSHEMATDFIRKLIDGENISGVLLYTRNRLMNKNERFVINEKVELVFRCWNAWRDGRKNINKLLVVNGPLPKLER